MPRRNATAELPSKADILAWLKETEGNPARRDVARAFGVKGPQRTELRRLLRELEDEGKIVREGRRLVQTDTLPPVAAIDVMSVDEDGDLLCLPTSWHGETKPPMIRLAARRALRIKPPPGVGDRLLARLTPAGDDGYDADIIKPIGRAAHRFLAVFRTTRQGPIAEPVERRSRSNFIIEKGREGGASDGDLVWLTASSARAYGSPRARVTEIAGHIDDRHAFSLIALAGHGVPIEFPAEVLREAEAARLPLLGERADLRQTPLVTIDPEDARDHDDAVFAARDDDPANPDGWRVIVAIADVSLFVPAGSALDREAQKRGNSIYLPDRVVPMLPERLSNDLCSLREGEDRPCLAVEMILSKDGRKRKHRFLRGMMRSAAKLAYGEAQAIVDGGKAPDDMREAVLNLHAAYRARLKERAHRAPLDLDLVERKIILDAEGRVRRVEKRERYDAHRLIEEFMILANVAAAETLEERRIPRIYRVHDAPDPEKLDSLREFLESLDYSLAASGAVRPSNFNQILKKSEARGEKELISEVILRSQKQAIYATDNLGHFGLNLRRYAHFTSPIRRYADLTVHRALVAAMKLGAGGQADSEARKLADIAEKISDCERRAMAIERETKDRYLAEYHKDHVGAEFEGRIRGVTRFGLFVMLDETGADGFAPIGALGAERFRFVEERHSLVGEATGATFRLGQPVRVRLLDCAPLTGGMRFQIVSDPIPGDGPTPRSRKKAPRTNGRARAARPGTKRRRSRRA